MLFSSAKYELLLEAIERRFFFRWRIISNKALICLACHEVVFYGMIECRRQREVNRDDEKYFCLHIWFIASAHGVHWTKWASLAWQIAVNAPFLGLWRNTTSWWASCGCPNHAQHSALSVYDKLSITVRPLAFVVEMYLRLVKWRAVAHVARHELSTLSTIFWIARDSTTTTRIKI